MESQQSGDDPTSHRCYNLILKMVLWDEPKSQVDQKLKINKVPQELAEKLYALARAERLSIIRGEAYKKLLLGGLLLGSAGTTFATFWFKFGFMPHAILFCGSIASAFGIWKSVDGITAFFMAGKVRGSVADEIS